MWHLATLLPCTAIRWRSSPGFLKKIFPSPSADAGTKSAAEEAEAADWRTKTAAASKMTSSGPRGRPPELPGPSKDGRVNIELGELKVDNVCTNILKIKMVYRAVLKWGP